MLTVQKQSKQQLPDAQQGTGGPRDKSASSQKSVAEDVISGKPNAEMETFGSLAFE